MAYIEFLRARKAFTIFALWLTGLTALVLSSVLWGIRKWQHAHDFHGLGSGASTYPASYLCGIAGYLAILFVSFVCASLSRENGRGGFAFTKPVSRDRLALEFFGIDLLAIVAAFVFAIVLGASAVEIATVATLGFESGLPWFMPAFDAGAWSITAIVLGAAFMWYGMLQAATAWRREGAGPMVGLAWPVFIVASSLYQAQLFGPGFHAMIGALDVLNPLGYVSSFGAQQAPHGVGGGAVFMQSLLGFHLAASLAITWGVGALGCVLAVLGWKRLEV